jgi:hypothetical protein
VLKIIYNALSYVYTGDFIDGFGLDTGEHKLERPSSIAILSFGNESERVRLNSIESEAAANAAAAATGGRGSPIPSPKGSPQLSYLRQPTGGTRPRAGSRSVYGREAEHKRGVYIYVADTKLHRVYIFHNLRYYGVFGGFTQHGAEGKFQEPSVSVDSRKQEVYVV